MMRKFTSKEAKKLIGKEVKICWRFISAFDRGMVLAVRGKNIQIDFHVMREWIWLPDILIEELETTQDAT